MGAMVRTHHGFARAVQVHAPDLVAFVAAPVGLENQFLAVMAEIGLAVVSFECQLGDIRHILVNEVLAGRLFQSVFRSTWEGSV